MPDKCDMEVGPCACGAWHGKGPLKAFDAQGMVNATAADDPRSGYERHVAERVSCSPTCDPDPCDPKDCIMNKRSRVVPLHPIKTLLKAAKDLLAAQNEYMLLRDRPPTDALRELAGQRVAAAAAELDLSIDETERRQAP